MELTLRAECWTKFCTSNGVTMTRNFVKTGKVVWDVREEINSLLLKKGI